MTGGASTQGKGVFLVTGGSRGIGAATALLAARHGYPVAIFYRDREDQAAIVLGAIKAAGGQAIAVRADVADEHALMSGFEAVDRFGTLQVLVNNAGITGGPKATKLHETSVDDFDRVWGVNTRGVFLMCHAAIPHFLEQGSGVIVNIASVAGYVAFPGRAAYTITKGAVVMLTRCIAVDYAAAGIRCNAVCPGMIDTPMTHWRLEQPDLRAQVNARIPQGDVGRVDDVANAVWFLASSEARYLNGSSLVVDGGYSSI